MKRAIKAVKAAGDQVKAVRFTADGFVVIIGAPSTAPEHEPNDFDEVLGNGKS